MTHKKFFDSVERLVRECSDVLSVRTAIIDAGESTARLGLTDEFENTWAVPIGLNRAEDIKIDPDGGDFEFNSDGLYKFLLGSAFEAVEAERARREEIEAEKKVAELRLGIESRFKKCYKKRLQASLRERLDFERRVSAEHIEAWMRVLSVQRDNK